MRRLLAVAAVTAAAFALPTPAQAYQCGGAVDYKCTGYFCSMDCFGDDCLVWVDPMHDPHRALCVSDVTE